MSVYGNGFWSQMDGSRTKGLIIVRETHWGMIIKDADIDGHSDFVSEGILKILAIVVHMRNQRVVGDSLNIFQSFYQNIQKAMKRVLPFVLNNLLNESSEETQFFLESFEYQTGNDDLNTVDFAKSFTKFFKEYFLFNKFF